MSEISFPSSFEELLNCSGFDVPSTELIMNMENDEIAQYLQELIDSGADLSKDDVADKIISFMYCSIDMFGNFTTENQSMYIQYLIDLCKSCVEQMPQSANSAERNAHKKVLYLFQHFCVKMETVAKSAGTAGATITATTKSKGSKKKVDADVFCWADLRVYALEVLDRLVGSNLGASWPMGLVQENFLGGVWGYTLKLLVDRPAGISGTAHKEIAARALCAKVFARTVAHFGNAKSSASYAMLSTALLEAIVQHEHIAVSVGAELLAQCRAVAPAQGAQVTAEILGEVCRMNYATMPAGSTKNIASFLEAFAKVAPAAMSDAFPVLIKQLDSPAHQIRSAIIQACGFIISYIHATVTKQETATGAVAVTVSGAATGESSTDDADSSERNTAGLVRSRDVILDILVERAHDVNPYTRAVVLKVWSRLLEAGSVPVKRVGAVAQIAVDRLQDKNAAVRRNAVVLMTTAIENNPFSGTLDAALFRHQQAELVKTMAGRLEELRAAYREANGLPSAEEEAAVAAAGKGKGRGRGGAKTGGAALKAITEADEEEEEESEGDEEGKGVGEEAAGESEEAQLERAAAEEEFLQSPEVVEDAALAETRAKMEYVASVLGVITSIETAVPKIAGMLQSKTTGDVVEALRFFTRAINFKVAGALALFKSAFSLVWHQDPAVKAEMLAAFSAVYLTDGAGEHAEALAPEEVARNLMHLARHCDAAEMASMEKIVGEMFSTRQVDGEVIEALWERVERIAGAHKHSTEEVPSVMPVAVGFTDLGASLRILSMAAHSMPGLLTPDRVALVVGAGLAPEVLQRGDFSALKAAAQCLQATTPFLKHCESAAARDAYLGSKLQLALAEATPMLATVLMGAFCGDSEVATREWFSLCEEAMHALFHLHPCPDQVVTLVVQHMYAGLSASAASAQAGQSSVCATARLLFTLGQVSLSSLVYTEFLAATAKKHPVKEDAEAKKAAAATAKVAKKAAKASDKASTTGFKEEVGAVDAMEEEMGAAAAADADHERVLNQIIEQELVLRNLLGKFLPLLSYLVANEQQRYGHALLRETSILAMCRYMCTSAAVCESLLPLLFTVLEKETAVTVRTSAMIALGDLAFRFPNSIEPWTHRMYSKLRDPNVTVRYNTLMVITHLVLNDMIKVKGQVSHVALSLNDPNEAIAELARLFFIKLSERSNNPVYNLLGDIIGVFSQEQGGNAATAAADGAAVDVPALSREQFQTTMHFLLSFVQKDKQADTLLERLLLRMSLSPSLLQRRNLAFCVSELTVTEKGVKKMIELIKNIKDALYDNEVYECFRTTLSRTKKAVRVGATSEAKSAVEEFEQMMERIHSAANGEEAVEGESLEMGEVREALEALEDGAEDGIEGAGAAKPVAAAKGKTTKTMAPAKKTTAGAKSKAAPKKRTARRGDSSDDDDGPGGMSSGDDASGSEVPDSDAENRAQGNRAPRGTSSAVSKSKAATKAATGKAAPAAARGRRAAVVRDDDNQED